MHFNNCGNNGKLKRFFILLLAAFMLVSTAFLAACKDTSTTNPNDDDKDEPVTEQIQEAFIKNGNFEDNYLTDYFPKTPKSWTSHGDTVDSDTASKTGSKTGVISVKDENFNKLEVFEDDFKVANPNLPTTPEEDEEVKDHILMIYNKSATAVKYKSQSISIPQNSYAKITVWVKTVGITALNPEYDHAGAYISLSESGNKNLFIVDGINTQLNTPSEDKILGESEWNQYVFIIEGSENSAKTVYAELGLGTGSPANVVGYTSGVAFFEDIELEFIKNKDYNTLISDKHLRVDFDSSEDSYFYVDADKQTELGAEYNRIVSGNTAENTFAFSYNNLKNRDIKSVSALNPAEATIHGSYYNNIDSKFIGNIEKGSVPSSSETLFKDELINYPFVANDIYYLNNKAPATQGIILYDDVITPKTSNNDIEYYRIGVKVKTSDFEANGLNLILLYKDVASSTGFSVQSFDNINTETGRLTAEELEKQENLHIKNDGWTEYVFYIQAAKLSTIEFKVEAWLGPQAVTGLTIESFTKGFALFGETSYASVSQAEYNAVSAGNTVKTVNFTTVELAPTAQIANGSFDKYASSEKAENITIKPLAPLNWTGYFGGDSRLTGNKDTQIVSATSPSDIAKGIINVNHLGNYIANYYISEGFTIPSSNKLSINNRLMISNKAKTAYGYVTPLKSLSTETYYEISVWVYNPTAENAYIYLTDTEGNVLKHNDAELKQKVKTHTTWVQYSFYVQTGELAKQFRLELFNGSRDGAQLSQGTILFSDAYMNTITETVYDHVRSVDYNGPDKGNMLVVSYDGIDIAPEEEETEEPAQPETPETPEEKAPFQFPWAVLTSLIVALALIFALFAVAFKKFRKSNKEKRKNAPVKKVKVNSYDRRKLSKIAKPANEKNIDEENEEEIVDVEEDN